MLSFQMREAHIHIYIYIYIHSNIYNVTNTTTTIVYTTIIIIIIKQLTKQRQYLKDTKLFGNEDYHQFSPVTVSVQAKFIIVVPIKIV